MSIENYKEDTAIVVTKLMKIQQELEELNNSDSPIRCRDLSLAYTHLEDCILRLNKFLTSN